jgi:4-hydroxy-tetrahydrodipicolinate reductase
MIRLAVAGAAGRMGRIILTLAKDDPAFRITGGLEAKNSPLIGTDIGILAGTKSVNAPVGHDPDSVLKKADVLIDFTHPSAMPSYLKAAVKNRTGYVIGTTGLDAGAVRKLKIAAKTIPIVQSPNMSVGVNLLFKLAEMTAAALDNRYDIEIAEAHHRMKKDAPSGTALKLLEVLAKARGTDLRKDTVYGRRGETGKRPAGQIGVLALRGGDVVGDHTVYFLGDAERMELTHRASSRQAFAQGALLAAKFVAKSKAGLYNMAQVLGIA